MTKLPLKERQKLCDLQKWCESKKENHDKSGDMDYCAYCPQQFLGFCKKTHEERVADSLCARAYNKMEKARQNRTAD